MLIDSVMESLRDEQWHCVHRIAEELDHPEEEVLDVLRFCAEFNFLTLDEPQERVRIDGKFRELLEEIC